MFKHEKLQLLIFIVLIGLQVLGVLGLLHRFHLSYLPVMLVVFFWGGISTTLYLHRYLTHRGFEMPEWLKFLFATGSAVTLAGDPAFEIRYRRGHPQPGARISLRPHDVAGAQAARFPPALKTLRRRCAKNLVLPVMGKFSPLRAASSGGGHGSFSYFRFRRDVVVHLRADALDLQRHLGGQFYLPHAAIWISQLSHLRPQPKQLSDRRRRVWRGLPQQSSCSAALRRARLALVGIRRHSLRHLVAREMRTRLGRGLAGRKRFRGKRSGRYFERSGKIRAGNDQSGDVALRFVAQIRRKPFFHRRNRLAGPPRIINHLISRDLSDAEIFRSGMREIKAAHTCTRMHGK